MILLATDADQFKRQSVFGHALHKEVALYPVSSIGLPNAVKQKIQLQDHEGLIIYHVPKKQYFALGSVDEESIFKMIQEMPSDVAHVTFDDDTGMLVAVREKHIIFCSQTLNSNKDERLTWLTSIAPLIAANAFLF